MMRLFILFSTVFLNLQFTVAQQDILKKPHLQFQQLTEGLNNERITSIHQDSLGYIWIGTYNGLHRFDGINFQLYLNNAGQNSIPNNRIEAIFTDSKGNLWIGTANGICRYNQASDNFRTFPVTSGLVDPSDPAPNRINAIVEDKNGRIWIGSEREGLFYFDPDQQEFIFYYENEKTIGLSSINITELCIGTSDDLWIGLTDGLDKLNLKTGNVTHFSAQPEHPHNIDGKMVRGMAMDIDGNLWVGSKANGLFLLRKEKQHEKLFDHYSHDPENQLSLGNNSVYTIFIDKTSQVWIGNENGGLHLYDRSSDVFYRYASNEKDPTSLSNNSIWSIFKDKQERLWIGTGLNGINIADPNFTKFRHYYSSPLNPHGLNNNLIRGFWEDKKGNVWIATDGGGLNLWDRATDKITHYTHNPADPYSIGSNALLDFTEDEEGRLWVATWAGSINVLSDREQMHFKKIQDIFANDSITKSIISSFALTTTSNGTILSGNYGNGLGLHDLQSEQTNLYVNDPHDNNSLSDKTVYDVLEDSEGNIWAGGENSGLSKMIKGENGKISFKRYSHDKEDSTSISGNIVNMVFEDDDQQIWLATSGGLSRYVKETDSFINFTTSEGLPSDFVVSIIEDKNGTFWIGTEKGLSKFDPTNNTFRNYTKNDGLQGEKFSRHAIALLSTGEIMIGGTNGFNIFDPVAVKDNPYKPEVYLTGLRLFNKPVVVGENDSLLKTDFSLAKEITFQHHQNVISLEFIALNYTHPTNNQYAYILEGLEEEWNYVGNTRMATYTNLDPGKYMFRVKASNNDGLWNEEGAKITLIVLPPWYKTWWFYTLTGLGLVGIFYTFTSWREKRLKEDKATLAEAIDAKTQELEKKHAEILARDEADKIRNWTATGLNQFSQIVNKNKDDIYILAQSILSHLVKFIQANQGTMTILNDDNEQDPYLELVASYAQDESKKSNTRFELTQGLLGACYASGEIQYIDNLPENYSKLTSGLGRGRMKHLVLVPLRLDEVIIGVIELASFNPLQEHEIEFLQKLGEIITSSLYTLKVSRKTAILLEQEKAQAEELLAQEEEIRQNLEELEATQEDFYRKEQELLKKLKSTEEENEKLRKALQEKKV